VVVDVLAVLEMVLVASSCNVCVVRVVVETATVATLLFCEVDAMGWEVAVFVLEAVFDIDFLTVRCTVPEVEVVGVLAAFDSLLSFEAAETAAEVESFLLAVVLDVLSAG